MVFLEISLGDWDRIIFGEGLDERFILEIILRTVFVYVLLVVSMRLMGKRMASQLSRLEMVSLVSLAAAIGIPVLGTREGLLPAVIIAGFVVLCQYFISSYNLRNPTLEKRIEGDLEILVKDGVFQLDAMARNSISRERLLAQLRSKGLIHTGEVKRLYLEANGSFSLVKADDPTPGLVIIPGYDKEFCMEATEKSTQHVCAYCGVKRKDASQVTCDCNNQDWIFGVIRTWH